MNTCIRSKPAKKTVCPLKAMELLAMELNNKVVLNSQDENSGEAVSNGLFLSNFLNALPKRGTMIENNE